MRSSLNPAPSAQCRQPLRHLGIGKLVHPPAIGADRERRRSLAPLVAIGIGAADEGVERFQPVRQSLLDQLFERPIDLQRRPQPVIAQPVENVIGRERRIRAVERPQHQILVARSGASGRVVVMFVMRMGHRLLLLLAFKRRHQQRHIVPEHIEIGRRPFIGPRQRVGIERAAQLCPGLPGDLLRPAAGRSCSR